VNGTWCEGISFALEQKERWLGEEQEKVAGLRLIVMGNTRHSGRSGGHDDKKFDFASPDLRQAAGRSASHRYFPLELKGAGAGNGRGRMDDFSAHDFRARWWPAPDSGQ
jgi:hypothetical protein